MSAVDTSVTSDPIDRITPGMSVIDVQGASIGTVTLVRRGDPNAVAIEGEVDPGDEIGDQLPHPEAGDEPTTAPDVAARLLRTGFIKIGGAVAGTREASGAGYAGVDQVSAVQDGVVRLAIPRSEVTRQA
ncbi:hypothetical protein ACN27F_20275 [Solwaraspora sp. WMMB335]|uniref:hypothetical protein n=1 Tax=Solwaraspora sp. WMMB335 TaxID=3404118 RepID=UPI003B960207